MSEILILSRRDLEPLVPFADYVEAVAEGFRLHAAGRSAAPAPLYLPGEGGGFHVKGASLPLGAGYVAFKTNANFPENGRRAGLPTIQGAVLLMDARTGTPLALLDSIEITRPFLGSRAVRPGTFIAAVGADNPEKSELEPELMTRAIVVPDVLDQAVCMGDLHHALAAGVLTKEHARAELGTLISGVAPGRARADEITIFDSTGAGIQDVAAAARAYELALARKCGSHIELA